MALFVGANEALKKRVQDILPDQTRVAFVSCPDVIHAAMMQILRENFNETENSTFSPQKEQINEDDADNQINEVTSSLTKNVTPNDLGVSSPAN